MVLKTLWNVAREVEFLCLLSCITVLHTHICCRFIFKMLMLWNLNLQDVEILPSLVKTCYCTYSCSQNVGCVASLTTIWINLTSPSASIQRKFKALSQSIYCKCAYGTDKLFSMLSITDLHLNAAISSVLWMHYEILCTSLWLTVTEYQVKDQNLFRFKARGRPVSVYIRNGSTYLWYGRHELAS